MCQQRPNHNKKHFYEDLQDDRYLGHDESLNYDPLLVNQPYLINSSPYEGDVFATLRFRCEYLYRWLSGAPISTFSWFLTFITPNSFIRCWESLKSPVKKS